MNQEKITFSFGKNWQDYLNTVSEEEIDKAKENIQLWLGSGFVSEKTVLDIGSGSGIHSLSYYLLGAQKIYSFDYDEHSVQATQSLWEKEGCPKNWTVTLGSILDSHFLKSLGQFDIVYSWGVLHHTGSMWEAVENASKLVKPGGLLWISLYAKGPLYPKHLALKKKFNSASNLGKQGMIFKRIGGKMLRRLKNLDNPFTWNQKKGRGMNVYHDIVDWLGGLPYEVASENEVTVFLRERGFILERIKVKTDGGCSIYVFSLPETTG